MSTDLEHARIIATYGAGLDASRLAALDGLRLALARALHPLPPEVVTAVQDALLALMAQHALTEPQRAALLAPLERYMRAAREPAEGRRLEVVS